MVDGDAASVAAHAGSDLIRLDAKSAYEPDGLFASFPSPFVGHGAAHDGIRDGPQVAVRAFELLPVGQGEPVDGPVFDVAEVRDGDDPPVTPVDPVSDFEVPVPGPAVREPVAGRYGDARIHGKRLAAT